MSIDWSIPEEIKKLHEENNANIKGCLKGSARKKALKEEKSLYYHLCEHITNYKNQ
jgi:hypothetical protein